MKARLFSLVLALTLIGLVAGCSGGASEDSGGSASSAEAPAAARGAADGTGFSGEVQADTAAKAAPANPKQAATSAVTRLVRTADLTVEVRNLASAAAQVRTAAVVLGGLVSAENTSAKQSVITLRVPEPRMDEALTKVATFGRQVKRTTTSDDVTATIADLDSRVASQTRSVTRIRNLMDTAKSLKDVVLIESELSRREADLEALQAKQRVLNDQADLSTITITLRVEKAAAAVAKKKDHGFLSGLHGGWHAVTATTVVVLTVLGAVLPATGILVLIGVPGYLLWRRFRPRVTPSAPAVPAP